LSPLAGLRSKGPN